MKGKAYRRYKTRLKDKRLKDILLNCSGHYNPYRGYIDFELVDGEWVPAGEYVKYVKNSNIKKFHKRASNRKVRRSKEAVNGNGYRKMYEYAWNID